MSCLMTGNSSEPRPSSPTPNGLANPFLGVDVARNALPGASVLLRFAVTNPDSAHVESSGYRSRDLVPGLSHPQLSGTDYGAVGIIPAIAPITVNNLALQLGTEEAHPALRTVTTGNRDGRNGSTSIRTLPRQDRECTGLLARYVQSVLPESTSDVKQIEQLANRYTNSELASGAWADITYSDQTLSDWRAEQHLERTLVLAKSWRMRRDAGNADPGSARPATNALEYWLHQDLQNQNWWWNEIGVPEMLGEITALLFPEISGDTLDLVSRNMQRSDWKRGQWTGANLVWGVEVEIVRGALESDPAAVGDGYARLYREIRLVPPSDDGIQEDLSFHQHGKQLYSGGYGLTFANDLGRFIVFAWGTHWQISDDTFKVYTAYLLDGERWLIRGKIIDYSSVGREIARRGKRVASSDWARGPISPVGAAYSLPHVVEMLARIPSEYRSQYRQFATRLLGPQSDVAPAGNKMFWCSDYMVHSGPSFLASVKMLSTRMQNGEEINGEGKRSIHLSEGANLLYRRGDEYEDIIPVWDWTRIPGTTEAATDSEGSTCQTVNRIGNSPLVGGVSNGVVGLSAMDLECGTLRGKKAWFFFPKYYVALGASITASGNAEIITDVNQTSLRSPVYISRSRKAVHSGTWHFNGAKTTWVYHDHVGYLVGSNPKVSLSIGPRSGRWSDIGTGSNSLVTRQVFDLTIDHGAHPNLARYTYAIVPGISLKQFRSTAQQKPFEIIRNNSLAQAVFDLHTRTIEAVFYEPGHLSTPLGELSVNHSCMLLLSRHSLHWEISISSPDRSANEVAVNVGAKQLILALPSGPDAGGSRSLCVSLAKKSSSASQMPHGGHDIQKRSESLQRNHKGATVMKHVGRCTSSSLIASATQSNFRVPVRMHLAQALLAFSMNRY